jgi:signal transduction histidine kinase
MEDNSELIHLLVIDDDKADRMALQRALQRTGRRFQLEEAEDGRTGLRLAQQQEFDCVFLDFRLPGESGLQVLQKMRAAGFKKPVIMLTGQGDEQVAVELMKNGAADYIAKDSVSPGVIQRSLQQALKIYQAEIQREEAEAALHRYTAELESQNQELDAFAYTVAHDLKTPLTAILGYTDLVLGRENLSPEQQRHFLTRVFQNGKKMENIILELLLLASIRKEEINIKALDMQTIWQAALFRLEHIIEGQEPALIVPSVWPAARGYGPWIEEVWVNYLSNALKYGERPLRIEVGAERWDDGLIRFWIHNNGPGIEPAQQERLFVPFSHFSQVRTDGQGLGLSIVRRIIQKLDGHVGVESEDGQGSTFWFALPAEEPPPT